MIQLNLINGSFSQQEAIDLLSQMVKTKISFHENKIANSQNEEDIKMREQRIKQIQLEWEETRKQLSTTLGRININNQIAVEL